MPTSHCRFPDHHHGPSAAPPICLLAVIAGGAFVIAFLHTIVVALVVVAILGCAAGTVFLLWHAAHAQPYDAPERDQERHSAAYSLTATPLPRGPLMPVRPR